MRLGSATAPKLAGTAKQPAPTINARKALPSAAVARAANAGGDDWESF